jgi:hypothetical protein
MKTTGKWLVIVGVLILAVSLIGAVTTDRLEFNDPNNNLAWEIYLTQSDVQTIAYDLHISSPENAGILYVGNSMAIADVLVVGDRAAISENLDVGGDASVLGDVSAERVFATGYSQFSGDVVIDHLIANNVYSDHYTPTLTNISNLDGSSAGSCLYAQNDDAISVSCRMTVDPGQVNTMTVLSFSLPVPSSFSSSGQCAGYAGAISLGNSIESGVVYANTTSNECQLRFMAESASNHAISVTFMYELR